ncbi:uncharacterized protein LOC111024665 [Momordica charantia]|uniref:Uncharacterized protein LOC111024665 n=1 Tax=Momordica charantia TaxID=3673 RepID=A0A6J1DYE5_MOMCH|nr:uncharacterized protein LOC111024665 [Momordica charantia]
MEEFAPLWTYQQAMEELKEKLLYTAIELESVKMEANQEMINNKENLKNLLNLLQMAYKERDEAKDQLHKLLNKFMLPSNFQAESPVVKANSSITESSSLSGSPVVDSFFDAVSSPDSGNNMDPSALVIESIVKGRRLPEKGRLLQSVMEAGPLLQTLLVAGPLPRWRNPPPLQPLNIPPVLINGHDMPDAEQKPAVMSRRCSTSSMLNFSGPSSSFSSAKRQRFH